jgi:uncharacterized membrane protein
VAKIFAQFAWPIPPMAPPMHPLEARRIVMGTPASIARHPIHPMLVVFPLGLLLTAVLFDILLLATGQSLWRTLAFYNLAAGIIGGLVAAVPGFIDYLTLRGPARRIGTWHLVVNVLSLIVFAVSFLLRTQTGAQWVPPSSSLPQALSMVGAVVLGVGGWLGGHLVYVHGMGVEAAEEPRRDQASRRRVA